MRVSVRYFHSQISPLVFPSPSTSYSKTAATLFRRDHVGDELWLKVIEFDKDSKKIVLSAIEYLKGKEQKTIDEYVAKHKLPPMTLKEVATVKSAPVEVPTEIITEQPPTSEFLM